ncbi:hypothetical protein B0H13DRAFT_2319938 [Mycena leptocephala]|nr:hypothetical protein B0H13DRAFT_2319938 [Mycena leptocephala]
MSYLSSVKCWARRSKTTVYGLQRDQMKGFDNLRPQGFYDAISAYGLPSSICDLDRAAQTDTLCYIRTAYGITEPISISSITKQGGSLSPIKSTLTTSLGHHYLNDILASDPDVLITSTKAQKVDPHLPDDKLQATIGMVEATDNSHIFSHTLPSLRCNVLAMERFQFAYGWTTNWLKSAAFVLEPPATPPDFAEFDSITDAAELKAFIDDFTFPKFIRRAPITLLRKIVMQNIISKARALLSLQPISRADTEDLDTRIKTKIHAEIGMPFMSNSEVLTLPTDLHGLEFPSIARVNDGIAIDGLHRDLNHQIPSYRTLARITLTDWTCTINNCTNPIDSDGLSRSFTQYPGRIPFGWIVAQQAMSKLAPKLCLKRTHVDGILSGDVSLSHILQLFGNKHPLIVQPDGKSILSLRAKRIRSLKDMGEWRTQPDRKLIIIVKPQPFNSTWSQATKQNWTKLSNVLRCVDADWFSLGRLHDSRPASAFDNKSVTAAITGPDTLALKIEGRNISILHGELMGLILSLTLSNPLDTDCKLYTDHLNSVRLIDDSKTAVDQQTRLHGMNGRSYYRWILALTDENPLTITYTPGHSTEVSIPARMNFEADHYASSAQKHIDVPTAPIPTFFMDEYTFFTLDDGWIESNTRNYVAKSQIHHASTAATDSNHQRMALQLYDTKPPPEYSYTHAGKLESPLCRLGCNAIEDQHHIFVDCPRYTPWHTTTANELAARTNNKLKEKGIEEADRVDLLAAVKPLFINDASIWPLQYSVYFLSHIPKFDHRIPSIKDPDDKIADKRLAHHLAADWHLACIHLAGRIWGN